MAEYNEAIQGDLDEVEVWQPSCNNYYRGPSGRIVTQWPHTMAEYRDPHVEARRRRVRGERDRDVGRVIREAVAGRFVGSKVKRVEDPRLLTGPGATSTI